ncbi:HlyD family secretion protein [Candidimonas humi]|nr:HlyD family secretion protein [Candidimonas humi]
MAMNAKRVAPIALTLLVTLAALLVLRYLWRFYMDDPWTRDAHVNADVVQVAPDVSGLVTDVRVTANSTVHRGDVLFVVDQTRYRIDLEQARGALAQSQAAVKQSRAALARGQAALVQDEVAQRQLQREAARDKALKGLVATEEIEVRRAKLERAQASVASARAETAAAQAGIVAAEAKVVTTKAAVDLAQVNLDRTVVRSSVDGRLGDRTVRVGDYVAAGRPVMAVLDTTSFRVDGYFEETRLHGIRPGQPVDIHIMGEDGTLHGHVQSIAAGIEDRYRSDGSTLLPNVTPAFDWVRLAQRVPVRISIDKVPDGLRLVAGRSATVSVVDDAHAGPSHS